MLYLYQNSNNYNMVKRGITNLDIKDNDNDKINYLINNVVDIHINLKFIEINRKYISMANDNKEYETTIAYSKDTVHVKKGIIKDIAKRSKDAVMVFSYITEHLERDMIQIELSPTSIAEEYAVQRSNISRGIKVLVEMGIIKKTIDFIPNTHKQYIINPSRNYTIEPQYVFNGSYLKLYRKLTDMRKNHEIIRA